jgi:adenylyl-sulfate kinase
VKSENVIWQSPGVTRERRWQALGQHGATVWLTGLPASGKSTLAACLEEQLIAHGRSAYRLDGDNMRHGLCGDLSFSPDDREENVRRVGEVARLFADAGTVVLVALVSPYRAQRDEVRALHERDGLRFVEVFVDTPVQECERRDPKGLYRRARAGELSGITGIDAPYEPPSRPEVNTGGSATPADAAALVLAALGLPGNGRATQEACS